jgi:hypothetical protein
VNLKIVWSQSKKSAERQFAAPTRVLSVVDWGHKPHVTGGVSFMQWSPDCRALAVGWRKQGLAVWSPSGCRLMCSLRQKVRLCLELMQMMTNE